MTNSFYNKTGFPSPNSPGSSAQIRNEFDLIFQAFEKFPTLSIGGANKFLSLNSTGSAITLVNAISGFTGIDGTPIGSSVRSTGAFTNLSANGSASIGNNVTIGGGAIDNTIIGGAARKEGYFTSISANAGITGNLTGNVTGNVSGNISADSGTSSFNNVTINGQLDMNGATSATIVNLSTPVNTGDAATKGYVDNSISNLINSAPGTLDTLNELAVALGNDPNFATTMTNLIGTKLSLAGGTMTGSIAMGSNKITGLGNPTSNGDATNKSYVDGILGSATAAAASASAAATSASQASGSAASALSSKNAAYASELAAASSAATANTKAGEASGSAASALAIYGSAAAQQTAVSTAQAQASLAAGYAASASSVVQQDLSGITAQALHRSPYAAGAMFIYDTSKDSDGGAWTEKCQNTSWYNEPLMGKWLGACVNETAARYSNATTGNELITNGSFASDISGWSSSASATISWNSGKLRAVCSGNAWSGATSTGISVTAGKVYRVSVGSITAYDASGNVDSSSRARLDISLSAGSASYLANYLGSSERIFSPISADSGYIIFSPSANATLTIGLYNASNAAWAPAGYYAEFDNISVKELTAINTTSGDYYQLTTDGKFYRLYKNLLTRSNEFTNAVWNKSAVSVAATSATTAPDGSSTAFLYTETGAAGHSIYEVFAATAGVTYTISAYMKNSTRRYGLLACSNYNNFSATFDLQSGTTTAASGVTSSISPVGNGWYRCSITFTATTTTNSNVHIGSNNSNNGQYQTYVLDGNTDLYIWYAQLEYGSTLTAYEAKTSDGTVTEVFRGNKAKFPKLAGIVAEVEGLTIYDLTEPGRPMWMRFKTDLADAVSLFLSGRSRVITSIAAQNGQVIVGKSGGETYYGGVRIANYAKDQMVYYVGYYGQIVYSSERISNRNSTAVGFNIGATNVGYPLLSQAPQAIPSGAVNAVAMTVLPDAPVDPVTGLQVPTIAVATTGGVSIIQNNGSVSNIGTANNQGKLSFIGKSLYVDGVVGSYYHSWTADDVTKGASANILTRSLGRYTNNGTQGYTSAVSQQKSIASIRETGGIVVARMNRDINTKDVFAHITNSYNTGYMVGDWYNANTKIRRCYLSDNTVGSVTGAELVTNGTFDTDTTGWTANGTISSVSGQLYIVNSNSAYMQATQSFTTVPNTWYLLTLNKGGGTLTQCFNLGTSGNSQAYAANSQANTLLFYATTATTVLSLGSLGNPTNGTAYWDNISVKPAIQDRSYKAAGASLTGTLTKSAVATNAQLVAYSGFSAANYLQEPYSADLDFGTGEWSVGAWLKTTYPAGGGNLFIYSEQVEQWYKNGCTITQDATTAPDGTTTADLVVIDNGVVVQNGASTAGMVWPSFNGKTINLSGGITVSYYFKKHSNRYARIATQDYGGFTTFDLDTGTVANNTWHSSFGAVTSNMTDAGNGWYRCAVNFPPLGTQGNILGCRIYATSGSIVNSHGTGDGTSGVYVWGGQLEVSTTAVPSTYVKTTTTPYSKNAPVASRSYSSGTKFDLGIDSYGYLTATAYDGTTTRTVTTTAAYNTATWCKAEAVYKTDGSLAIFVNGQEVAVTRGNPLLSLTSGKNLLTYSQEFDNAAWTKTNVTVTANATTAPDGTSTADKVVETATTTRHGIMQLPAATVAQNYIFSVYAKAAERNWLIVWYSGTGGVERWSYFDLTSGVVGNNSGSVTATIASVGSSWYRCSISFTGQAYNSPAFLAGVSDIDNNNPYATYAGDVTKGIYIWGAQLEQSASVTSYCATNVAPLTVGNSYALDAPFPGSIALLKLSATAPTYDQASWMYEQEKQLFRDGAQCCLPDTNSIVDLTYDDVTDKWVAVSSTNESSWTGLVRTNVTAVPAGSNIKVYSTSGVKLNARSTTNPGVDVTIPAYGLREELLKDAEDSGKLARIQVPLDFVGGFTATTVTGNTAITSVAGLTYPSQTTIIGARVSGSGIPANTTIVGVSGTTIYLSAAATASASAVQISFVDFVLPIGMEAKEVVSGGAIKTEGSTKDYTRLYDGFRETIRFGTAPGYTAAVQIVAIRSQT